MKTSLTIALVILLRVPAFSQATNVYEVYAVEYAKLKVPPAPIRSIALGATSTDSVHYAVFVWYLKGDNGRGVLVDAGFVVDTKKSSAYLRHQTADRALERIHVKANDITDLIITHPHWDHIGGLHLFPKATVWMQRKDFAYFVGDAWQKGAYREGLEKQDVPKIIQANLEGRLNLVEGDSLEIIPGIRVFIGSKHTYENQYVLVDTRTEKVLIASDACWFYYNLQHLAPIPLTSDTAAYVRQLRRMLTLVKSPDLIIPGHDPAVLTKYSPVAEGVVRIR